MVEASRREAKYNALLSRVGKDLLGIRDVYVSVDSKHLFHYPIAFMKFEEVLSTRRKLSEIGKYKLVAVEAVQRETVAQDPYNPKRSGCFRKTEWLSPDLDLTRRPEVIRDVKKHLEKESKWLSGGPRPPTCFETTLRAR